jgi:hypothetical protein
MIQLYCRLTFCLLLTLCASSLLAQPKINSFSPASGPAGTTVTINGTNFNTTPDSNYVWFGGTRGSVTAATATQLTVRVPASATYDPISVLNRSTQGIGYSNRAFLETFNSGATDHTVINPTRYAPVNFPAVGGPETPITADIDGDGKPDLLVDNGGVVAIFRNTSTVGTIDYTSLAAYVTFYAGQGDNNYVVRDLNGDGKPDLLCSSNQNNFHAYISVNTSTPGHISFSAAQAYAFSGGFIDAADMDGDGRLDLVMANQGGVALWLNTTVPGGALSFANPVTYGISGNTAGLSVIDIDGDGKPDVVCANAGDKTISILRNTTPRIGVANDSSFAPYLVVPTNRSANHLLIRDIDADGKPDIILTTDSGIAILKNLAAPGSITNASFAAEVDIPVYPGITGVAVADLDGDGKPDITTSSVSPLGGFASILKNITTPGTISAASFVQHTDIHAGGWGDGIFTADIDGDSRPEIIVSNSNYPGAMSIIRPVINTLPPTLSQLAPDSATTGQTVTLTGHNLSGTSAVSFGGTPAASFVTVSDSVITAVPAGGTTGNIGVTTSLGSATIGGFQYIVAPNVTTFTPATAGRGDTVTITGSHLTGADTVRFGGVPADYFTVVNDNTVKALIGNIGATGNLVIRTPYGGDTVTGFTYKQYPLLTSFSPIAGKTGDIISIHGKFLTTATAVSFGGIPATTFTIVSDTVVNATVGAGGTGAINVTTPSGVGILDQFTYIYPTPTLTGFSPASGPAGTTVTITGSGFDPVPTNNSVYFGGAKAFVSQASATSLTVTVPAAATLGPLTVTSHRKTIYGSAFRLNFAGGGTMSTASFATPVNVAPGYATTLLDADGDGKLDIATQINGVLTLIRNTGAGNNISFGPVPSPASNGLAPRAIIYADIDGDGRPDLIQGWGDGYPMIVFANSSTKGTVSIQPGIKFPGTALDLEVVGAGDFNKDGKPDIAAAGNYTQAVAIETNTSVNSNIAFGAETTAPITQGPGATLVDDFDGDGKADIVVAGIYASEIYAFRNTSVIGGTISFSTQPSKYDYGINQMVSGDIDGDSKPDLVATMNDNTIHVYLNTSAPGAISFSAPIVLPSLGAKPGYLALGDLDGDGKLDIITSETTSKTLSVLHNTSTSGTAAFDPALSFNTDINPGMVAIGDVNGDGRPDIVLNANGLQYVYQNLISSPSTPTLTSFSPANASTGATITITGTHLTGATSVTLGGAPVNNFTVVSDNSITATVGAGTSGSVMVTTPNGSASLDAFTYIPGAPHVTGFTPQHAAAGTTVTISGTNLDGVTNVNFGGISASSIAVLSPTTITATVSAGSATGSVALFSPTGTDSLAGFSFIPPPPAITAFTPAAAATGNVITITGTNFTGVTAVSFGGTQASYFTVVNPTTINAVVNGGTTGNVMVTTLAGTATLGGFTYMAPTSAITSFTPAGGAPGTTVTIVGTGFNGTSGVQFGGAIAASFQFISSDTIQATIGAGSTGTIAVTDNYGTVYSAAKFTVTSPAATITSFNPAAATTNMTVVITGTHLTGATAVSFGGTAAASFTIMSDNEIDAVVGAGATGNLVVTMPGGPLTLSGFTFTPYIVAPTLTSMNPYTANQGTQVSLFGGGFTGTTRVTFGGVPAASFTVVSDGVIHATIGSGASGAVVVTNPMGSSQITGFVWHPVPPTITYVDPSIATSGGSITIHGTNLTTTSSISIGGWPGPFSALNITVLSDTTVSCTVNTLSVSGPVTLYTSGGQASLANLNIVPAGTPAISSISPATGPAGTVVTINGVNLGNTIGVGFGGVASSSFTIVSPNQITAVVGQGATGAVTVNTSTGNTSFNGFTYTGTTPPPPPPPLQRPQMYSVNPTRAKQGDVVSITGRYLDSVYSLSFGGVAAQSFHAVNDSLIQATIGTGATGIIIAHNGAGGDSLYGFVFDTTAVVTPPDTTNPNPPSPAIPHITSFSPTQARKGDTVLISGTNLDSIAAVTFGGVAAQSFSILSADQVRAIVGPGASGKVFVRSNRGAPDSLAGFTFDTTARPPADTTSPVTPVPPTPTFTLASFTGSVTANQAGLQWKALHEQHISYYAVEQGTDTLHWSTVTQISARELDSASYAFTDTASRSGLNFYRLAIIDNSGDSSFSPILNFQFAGVPPTLTLYPNPVTTNSFVVNVPVISSPSQFQLVDMSGNIVSVVPVPQGVYQAKITVTSAMRGVYYVTWRNGNQSSYQLVLILK